MSVPVMPTDDAQDRRALAVSRAMDEAARPSALLLACGEMTAQEMRTAKAVARLMTSVALDALRTSATPDDREAERVRAAEEVREACALVAEEGHYGVDHGPAGTLALKDELRAVKISAHGDGDGIAAAIRALPIPEAARPAEDDWRTMESAPRDGSDFLIAVLRDARGPSGEIYVVGEAHFDPGFDPAHSDGSWFWAGESSSCYGAFPIGNSHHADTRWRPLPPPPRALSTGPGGADEN